MKTLYVKRYKIHQSARWCMHQTPCYTELLRATVVGKNRPVIWEWVCTGRQLSDGEVIELFKRYPMCEFQDDDDLAWRSKQYH